MKRLPIVGVMGSAQEAYRDLAEPLGRLIAGLGYHLLTGGRTGVMESVSRAFCSVENRPGRSIGILPDGADANPFVEVPIYTQLSAESDASQEAWRWSRNHINVRSSTVVVALPGGSGTASELALAAAGPHKRPCLAFMGRDGRLPTFERLSDPEVIVAASGARIPVAMDISEVNTFLVSVASREKG